MEIEKLQTDNQENSDNNNSCKKRSFPKKFEKLFNSLKDKKLPGKLVFIIIGIVSTVWFLIRVIPKPQRAAYPCMRVAAPFMSGFVLWLLSITTAWFSYKHSGKFLKEKKYLFAGLSLFVALAAGFSTVYFQSSKSFASQNSKISFVANSPVGVAQGFKPGRVAWVWNPDATNENMKNKPFDYWYQNGNANQGAIDLMLDKGIQELAGIDDTFAAWDSLFTSFNIKQGREKQGYKPGEKIVVKLNLTNSVHPGSYSNMYGTTEYPEYMDNTPELVLALLKQLVNVYHVNQNDIYIGDNFRAFRNTYWKLCHTAFPDVHYFDGTGKEGREKTVKSATEVLHFSDGTIDVCLPQHYLDATYMINMPSLKTHGAGGITTIAKNHQGSIIKLDAKVSGTMNVGYAHASLPDAVPAYKSYRHLVDYMGHKDMGGKTVLNIIDGIWGGREFWGKIFKWDMEPFNGDYPSSIFLSQDAVAIESVAYDFMLEEFKDKPGDDFPLMAGVDDYLYQAADKSYWPAGLQYDPEKDGTPIGSLGVYEHWNNAAEKKYSRNLNTGEGIELVKSFQTGTAVRDNIFADKISVTIYPNPVAEKLNIEFINSSQGTVAIKIFNLNGQLLRTVQKSKNSNVFHSELNVANLNSGTYIVTIDVEGEKIRKEIIKN
jgi:hypothetical protein